MKPLLLVCAFPLLSVAAVHEVTVYSHLTDDGKAMAARSAPQPVGFVVTSGGYRELGSRTRGERPLTADQIEALLKPALEKTGFQPTTQENPEGKIILRYTWGCANPIIHEDATGQEFFVNQAEMLGLVGAQAVAGDPLQWHERREIMRAARECRYFLTLAAYDLATYAQSGDARLLWKTQMSVCSDRLAQRRAFPLLVAAGASLFGRETPLPRRITIDVKGILNVDVSRR